MRSPVKTLIQTFVAIVILSGVIAHPQLPFQLANTLMGFTSPAKHHQTAQPAWQGSSSVSLPPSVGRSGIGPKLTAPREP